MKKFKITLLTTIIFVAHILLKRMTILFAMKRSILLFSAILITTLAFPQVNLQQGLVAYYPFNGNANDESGNGNDGTVFGAIPTIDRFGNLNSTFIFDGVNDYISVPNSQSLQSDFITVAAWIKPNQYYSGSYPGNAIVYKGSDQHVGHYGLAYLSNSHKFDFHFKTNNQFLTVYSNTIINLNQQYFVCGTFDGAKLRIYINGVLEDSTIYNGTIPPNNDILTIAKMDQTGYPYWVNGTIDDIRIYNRSLTESEIQILYLEGATTPVCTEFIPITHTQASQDEIETLMINDGISSSLINNFSGDYVYKVIINAGGGVNTNTWLTYCLDNKIPVSGIAKGESDDPETYRTQIGTDPTFENLYHFNNLGWVDVTSYIDAEQLYSELNSKWGSNIDTWIYFWFGTNQPVNDFGYGLVEPNIEGFGSITIEGFIENNSINEVERNRIISIFPNPTTERIKIDYANSFNEKLTVEISNIYGLSVFQTSLNDKNMTLDISTLSSGIYIISIKDSRGISIKVKKIIKE